VSITSDARVYYLPPYPGGSLTVLSTQIKASLHSIAVDETTKCEILTNTSRKPTLSGRNVNSTPRDEYDMKPNPGVDYFLLGVAL